jgi:hypothetical protein
MPIESITEGAHVLTHADPEAYGLASDEDVVNSLNIPFIGGISKLDECQRRPLYSQLV